MSNQAVSFMEFVRESATAFQAVETIRKELEQNGYRPLNEIEVWNIVPGGKYYVTRNRSSVIALNIPQNGFSHFQIVASHSDSPTFKLKANYEDKVGENYVRLNTERYGGMLMATWFDRPLSIAGRLMVKNGSEITTKLVDLNRDAVLIPNMPIHFNRDANDGYKYNAQVDTLPLYGDGDAEGCLKDELAKAAGADAENVIAGDLFLYNRMPGSVWGAHEEFFSCPRIDDLECAYTSLQAFLTAGEARQINVYAVFDNEEVGSGTKQGAHSTFLTDVLNRVGTALGATDGEIRAAIASGFMVSADNAHALHPNHTEKYDAENRTFMNGGVVIKHNANQKYTTDAVSCAIFSEICARAGVPAQMFNNRSDVAGGSTLGNIANAHASMNTVDIGLPQLAMHSCYETAGVKDVDYMIDALRMFYSTNIQTRCDGGYALA